jgi:hypothetical protein
MILPKPLPSLMAENDLEYQVEEIFCGSGTLSLLKKRYRRCCWWHSFFGTNGC